MPNDLLLKFKRLPRKERNIYLLIALIILIIVGSGRYGPLPGRAVASGTQLNAWCKIAKENIVHYTESGMTCGLWRDGGLITLGDAEEVYSSLYCELVCYDCDTETSSRGLEVCSAGSQYIVKPYQTPAIDQTTDIPEYGADDGDDAFVLSWVSAPEIAYRNEEVKIIVKVKNPDMIRGKMKVQCSMLDPDVHTWMQAIQAVNIQNCVRGEPFTETKIVTLGQGELGTVTFNPTAPNKVGTYRYYCSAFERCSSEDPDTGESSSLKDKYIKVKERPADYPVVDPDSEIEEEDGEKGFVFENPFKDITAWSDLTEWWEERNVMQKFLIVFSGIFVVLFVILLIGEKKQRVARW